MAEVLVGGYTVLVDEADLPLIAGYTWRVLKCGKYRYAIAWVEEGRRRRSVRMHRLILGAATGQMVDHINNYGLDNRRSNIRLCTNIENSYNRRKQSGSSSRYKGVSFHKSRGDWQARICINQKVKHLGYYPSEKDAAEGYDEAAKEHFGQFACLNSC